MSIVMRFSFVDGNGHVTSTDSPAPSAPSAHAAGSLESLLGGVANELRQAIVGQSGHRCHVWLPADAPSVTMAAAIYRLVAHLTAKQYNLHYTVAGRTSTFAALSFQAFIERLGDICEPPPLHRADDYRSVRCSLERLDARNPLLPLFDGWRVSGGRFDRATMLSRLQGPLSNRYIIATPENGAGLLRLQEIGTGYWLVDKSWRARLPGNNLLDQPDYYYAQNVVNDYRLALLENTPILQSVDAYLEVRGKGRRRGRYHRLVIPFEDRRGERLLLSSSFLDDSIDLRGGAGQIS
ncbi:MAG: hypothetical protein R3D31_15900 [Hyphomicrobiaceae bacterium]